MNEQENKSLLRQLTPVHVWAIALGSIVGWGSFVNPGKKFLPNSGVAGTAIAMAMGAVVMIIIACSYAYMIPKYPKAGGEFTFTKECFGKNAAFVCGWFLVAAYLTNVPMNSTAIGLIVDGLDGSADILKFGFHYSVAGFEIYFGEMILAMSILILFAILNILGVKKVGAIQTLLAGLLVGSVVVLTIAVLVSGNIQLRNLEPVWGFDKAAVMAAGAAGETIKSFAHTGATGIATAILTTFAIAPWAYVGFDTIPQAVEELGFPYKKVVRLMIIAIFIGCFVYTANNTVAALALANWPDSVMAGEWVLLVAAEEILGTFGKVLIGIAVSCAVLSGIMGFYLASSRLLYAMAKDAYLPKVFAEIDPKYGTPRNAILFCMVISLSGPILGREALGWFVDMSALGAAMGYFFTCASARRKMHENRDGTPGMRKMAAVGVAFSAAFMVLQTVPIPGLDGVHFGKESYWMLMTWIVLGAWFYWRNNISDK